MHLLNHSNNEQHFIITSLNIDHKNEDKNNWMIYTHQNTIFSLAGGGGYDTWIALLHSLCAYMYIALVI